MNKIAQHHKEPHQGQANMLKTVLTHGPLFEAVQRSRLFADSKSFVDAELRSSADTIEAEFRGLLSNFVEKHFRVAELEPETPNSTLPPAIPSSDNSSGTQPLEQHIDALWSKLERPPLPQPKDGSSLLALPAPYIVPGGRFRELYYWDTYFSALGLRLIKRHDLILGLAQNFADLIERYGFIPNGNRSYFLSRSQPPFFVCLLEMLEQDLGFMAIVPFLPALEKEYAFWMRQGEHAVRLPDGEVLNRYWDSQNIPRAESFAEDLELSLSHPENPALCRERRAGAESGWDFSGRWNRIPALPQTIRTTELAPIDLNSVLYQMETVLGRWLDNPIYSYAAKARQTTLLEQCYDPAQGWFFDLEVSSHTHTGIWTLAGVYPLFFGIANPQQAARIAANLEEHFLRPGGLISTLLETGEQWDAPNGWAPLQWMACVGLERYGFLELAREIAIRFVELARVVWQRTGKLMEKYNVVDTYLEAGGGEYTAQDGFGWTNGVVRALIDRYHLV